MVAVDEVELGAQLVVDALRARVVPGRVGHVEQVQDGKHLRARAHRGADELEQVPGAHGHGAGLLQLAGEPVGFHEHLVHDALVVVHGRALRDGERHHAGALERQAVDHQDALLDVGPRLQGFAYGELFVQDLGLGQAGTGRGQTLQLRHAHLGRDVEKDHGAKGVDEDHAARRGPKPQVTRRALGLGIGGRQLLEGKVLDKGGGEERMSATVVRHRCGAWLPAPLPA